MFANILSNPYTVEKNPLNPEYFDFIRNKLEALAGIHLGDNKQDLVNGRLRRRAIDLKMENLADYIHYLSNLPHSHCEWQFFINELTTNKTEFFREPEHYDFLLKVILENHPKGLPFRVWSAASSSGEEAYSIAAILHRYTKTQNLNYFITASDIDTEMISRAKNGVYRKARIIEVPRDYHREMFTVGQKEVSDWIRVRNEIRKNVAFTHCNLTQSPFPWANLFHVIICRNVFIYFSPTTIERVCKEMYDCAENGAYFIIGHSESLHNVKIPWVQVKPSIYKKIVKK